MTVDPDVESLITDRKLMAHLATSRDDRPHAAPIWYGYDDGVVEFLTEGRKLENVRANPRVALSIQDDTDGDAEWFVTLLGTATVVDDHDRTVEAARRVFGKYLGDPETWDDRYRKYLDGSPRKILVRVEVGSATATRY